MKTIKEQAELLYRIATPEQIQALESKRQAIMQDVAKNGVDAVTGGRIGAPQS